MHHGALRTLLLFCLPKLGRGVGTNTHSHEYHGGLNPKPLRSTPKAWANLTNTLLVDTWYLAEINLFTLHLSSSRLRFQEVHVHLTIQEPFFQKIVLLQVSSLSWVMDISYDSINGSLVSTLTTYLLTIVTLSPVPKAGVNRPKPQRHRTTLHVFLSTFSAICWQIYSPIWNNLHQEQIYSCSDRLFISLWPVTLAIYAS